MGIHIPTGHLSPSALSLDQLLRQNHLMSKYRMSFFVFFPFGVELLTLFNSLASPLVNGPTPLMPATDDLVKRDISDRNILDFM
jgi:hypothetical protein